AVISFGLRFPYGAGPGGLGRPTVVRRVHPDHRQFVLDDHAVFGRPDDVGGQTRPVPHGHVFGDQFPSIIKNWRIAVIGSWPGDFWLLGLSVTPHLRHGRDDGE